MHAFSDEQIETLAKEYGQELPGLANELKQKLHSVAITIPKNDRLSKAIVRDSSTIITPGEAPIVSERIVMVSVGARPVARILDNQATTDFLGVANASWADAIRQAKPMLDRIIPAVGRIELNNSDYPWVGTGWMIDDGIVVTNAHVADVFAKLDNTTAQFVFRRGLVGGTISSHVDFLEEEDRLDSIEHPVLSILWVAPAGQADVAFLKVGRAEGRPPLPRPIPLSTALETDSIIAAIGYPARDTSIRDQKLVTSIFGDDVYDKKRLAPGKLLGVDGIRLQHDCSTLGGNSGSVLLDFKTGAAIGLHQGGLLDDSANLGVTSIHLRTLLDNALKRMPSAKKDIASPSSIQNIAAATTESGIYTLNLNIPLDVTIKIGSAGVTSNLSQASSATVGNADINEAVRIAKARFQSDAEVVAIRKGFRFKNGWITDEPVVVIEVREKLSYNDVLASGKPPFPREIAGFGIDVRTASLLEQLQYIGTDLTSLERVGKPAGYREPTGYDDPESGMALSRVKARMDAIFHVSPDAGFRNLKAFFGRVKKHVTATMYEWEPNHISDALEKAMSKDGCTLTMVTQRKGVMEKDATLTAVEDMQQRIGSKFHHVWASTRGPQRLIPNSYHIKVASRDKEEFWLSSGNWKDSNQPENTSNPNLLREHNREWHAIIRHKKLATLFQKYIEFDFEQAQKFPLPIQEAPPLPDIEFLIPATAFNTAPERRHVPTYESELIIDNGMLDIQPLLTPDRDADGDRLFLKTATAMIERATKSILIENQSFKLTDSNNAEFNHFFDVLKKKQRGINDVRIIFRDARDYPGASGLEDQQKLIERLKDFGLDVSPKALRMQSKCHTKGIIVDSKEVLLGSQNLTNEGSLFNRDASLLVRSKKVAAFFEKIFLYDWEYLAHNNIDERVGGIRRAQPGEETPAGFVKVSLATLLQYD